MRSLRSAFLIFPLALASCGDELTRASRTDTWSAPTTVYLDPNPSAGNSLDWARTKNVLVFTTGQYAGAAIELLNLDALLAGVDIVGIGLRPTRKQMRGERSP